MTKTIELPERGIVLPLEIENITRRDFLKGSAGLLVLGAAGCGGEEGGDEASGKTRDFTDETGRVEIPAEPRRVVTLDDRTLEAALSVEAPVVGAVGRYPDQAVPPAFEDLAEGIEIVGVQPNLEAIAALEPDLILGQAYIVEESGGDLRRIAPVVVLDYWKDDSYIETRWREHFLRVAEALGRQDRAREELRRLERAVEGFREDFPGDPAEVELSIVQLQTEEWLFFTGVSFCGEIADRLGFSRPEVQRRDDTDRVYLSYERLSLADGDAVMLTVDALEEGVLDRVDEVTSGALWRRLDAVRDGAVHRVDGYLWLTGGSVPAGLAIVEDLRRAFVA